MARDGANLDGAAIDRGGRNLGRILGGRELRARLTQPADEWWDRRLGVRTFGYHPASGGADEGEWHMHYIPAPYRDVFRALRLGQIKSDDMVIDVGSGLGRAVFAAAWLGAARAEGVEHHPALVERARANYARSRLARRDIRFACSDARLHDYAGATLLYLFHPFGRTIVGELLDKVRADRRRSARTRPLRIVYMNPVADDVFAASGWLRLAASAAAMPTRWSSARHYPTSVWQAID